MRISRENLVRCGSKTAVVVIKAPSAIGGASHDRRAAQRLSLPKHTFLSVGSLVTFKFRQGVPSGRGEGIPLKNRSQSSHDYSSAVRGQGQGALPGQQLRGTGRASPGLGSPE